MKRTVKKLCAVVMTKGGRMSKYKESWKAADVQCPFFIGEHSGNKGIVCEGWEARMKVAVQFSSFTAKNTYMGCHCTGPYQRCKLYQITMSKYEID